jgi:hypothetical protein
VLRGKLLLDRSIPPVLFDFVKEVSWLLFHLLVQGLVFLGLVIFEVLVAIVIGTTATAAATAMIFLKKLEVILVERPRDHPVLFQIALGVDLNLSKATI